MPVVSQSSDNLKNVGHRLPTLTTFASLKCTLFLHRDDMKFVVCNETLFGTF